MPDQLRETTPALPLSAYRDLGCLDSVNFVLTSCFPGQEPSPPRPNEKLSAARARALDIPYSSCWWKQGTGWAGPLTQKPLFVGSHSPSSFPESSVSSDSLAPPAPPAGVKRSPSTFREPWGSWQFHSHHPLPQPAPHRLQPLLPAHTPHPFFEERGLFCYKCN